MTNKGAMSRKRLGTSDMPTQIGNEYVYVLYIMHKNQKVHTRYI